MIIAVLPVALALAAQSSASATNGPAGDAADEEPILCVAVHIDPTIRSKRSDPRYDIDMTNAFGGKLAALFRQHGISTNTPGGRPKITVIHGLNGLNPRCVAGEPYRVTLNYTGSLQAEIIRTEISIERRGRIILRDKDVAGISQISSVAGQGPKAYRYISEDLNRRANEIFDLIGY